MEGEIKMSSTSLVIMGLILSILFLGIELFYSWVRWTAYRDLADELSEKNWQLRKLIEFYRIQERERK
jgi:hypothetical protein